jgi:hypothetical protein
MYGCSLIVGAVSIKACRSNKEQDAEGRLVEGTERDGEACLSESDSQHVDVKI